MDTLLMKEPRQKPKQVPLKDFFRNPEKTQFSISPDGTHLSFLAPYKNRLNIYVQKIGSTDVVQLTHDESRDIPYHFWINDTRLLYIQDTGGDENYKLYGVDKDGSNLKDLTPFPEVTIRLIDDLVHIPTEIIIGMNHRDKRIFDAYRLNVSTGKLTMVGKNPGNINRWMTDHDGKLRVAQVLNGVTATLLYRDTEEAEFTEVITTDFKESLNPFKFTEDNQYLYCSSNLGRDKSALVKFDPKTGEELAVLFEHEEVDVMNADFSKVSKKLTFAIYHTWKKFRHFFDEGTQQVYKKLASHLPEKEFYIASDSLDETKLLVAAYNDRSKSSYYYYNTLTEELIKLADSAPWIKEGEMSKTQPVTYTSRDGLTIHGYLTVPIGMEAKNLPVVVNPHGGPWARDHWGYNSEVQFLANRGYAVFQMNFRGSIGYGREFWECSFKQWGRTMQDDITDGVQWLIKEGIADPKRVAIYGASYGGYATLMGIVKTPKLYACAVDYVGVSNMFTFMETIPPYWELFKQMQYEMVGHPEKDKEMLAEVSPALHIDKMVTPLLIAQGAKDPRVNQAESDQIVAGFKERGIDVQYILKENEGHGFHNEENKFEFYQEMEKFLAKHMS